MEPTTGSPDRGGNGKLPLEHESHSTLSDVKQAMTNWGTNAKEVTEKAVNKSVGFAKEYPVHTAIGAGAIGFLAGLLARRR